MKRWGGTPATGASIRRNQPSPASPVVCHADLDGKTRSTSICATAECLESRTGRDSTRFDRGRSERQRIGGSSRQAGTRASARSKKTASLAADGPISKSDAERFAPEHRADVTWRRRAPPGVRGIRRSPSVHLEPACRSAPAWVEIMSGETSPRAKSASAIVLLPLMARKP